jgi:uncharacterized damage-inducible protein DinB
MWFKRLAQSRAFCDSVRKRRLMAENRAAVEPWMRGTHEELPAVLRAVIHALELAREDVERWCGHLTDEEWNLRPQGLAPAAFHVRHMARSIDRVLTYVEGEQLSGKQMELLKGEMDQRAKGDEVLGEFEAALGEAKKRIRAFAGSDLEAKRALGRKALPTSVGGLLVHVAEHTSRHVGQVVTTAKLAVAARGVF